MKVFKFVSVESFKFRKVEAWRLFEVVPIISFLGFLPKVVHSFFRLILGLIPFRRGIKIFVLLLKIISRLRWIKIFKILFKLICSPFEVFSLIFSFLFSLFFHFFLMIFYFRISLPFSNGVISFSFRFVIQNLISVRDVLKFFESVLATTLIRMVELSQTEESILYLSLRCFFSNF